MYGLSVDQSAVSNCIPGRGRFAKADCAGCNLCGSLARPAAMRHSMGDWLELHTAEGEVLEPGAIADLVERARIRRPPPEAKASAVRIDPDEALLLVAAAMRAAFPDQSDLFDDVVLRCEFDFDPAPGPSYTLQRTGLPPFIRCPFNGTAADLMTLAHEFGHAVQMVAAGGRFIPPASREIAAFFAERLVIDELAQRDSPLLAAALAIRHRGDARYLGIDAGPLLAALADPARPYTYRHNYPLARLAAHRAASWLPRSLQWEIFAGRPALAQFLETIDAKDDITLGAVSFADPVVAARLHRYRQLGIFVERACRKGGPAADLSMDACLALAAQSVDPERGDDVVPPATGRIDRFAAAGMALELFAASPLHRRFRPGRYFPSHVTPALKLGQARAYLAPDGTATAFMTWAWLSPAVEADLHATGRTLGRTDWISGDRPFVHDWVALQRGTEVMVRDLKYGLFQDHVVTGLRRRDDGSIRRIGRWIGANVPRLGPHGIQAAANAKAGRAPEG